MEEETKVSRDIMKTLSVDTRVDILKLLDKRPMTASEIARALDKHVTTVSDHLNVLQISNLVERIERPGRKWVYYKITEKADTILHPKVYQRWVIVLSLSLLVLTVGFISLVNGNPGEPLYGLERFRETVQLALTHDEQSRTQLYLQFAEERLKEAKFVAEKNETETAKKIIQEYRKELENVKMELEKAGKKGKDTKGLQEEVSESKAKHKVILENIEKKQPKLKSEIEAVLTVIGED